MSAREKKLAYLAWLTICVVWGTTYLGIRIALESLPVALLAGLRWLAAGFMMLALLPFLGERLPARRQWGGIALVGFLMNVIGNLTVVWAQQYVASGLAAVIVAMVPFWSVGVEAAIPGGERFTRYTVLGLITGFAGIVVLVWPQLTVGGEAGRLFVAGVLAMQFGSLSWAIGTSYTKRHGFSGSPLSSIALQMLFSGLMLTAIGTVLGEWPRVVFTPRTFAALVYLAVAGSVIGYTAYVYALKHLPMATVSLYAYVNPIIAVILGTLLMSEPLNSRIALAAMLVFAGIVIVRLAPAKATPLAPVRQKAVA
jgi:drug/metabolite transporter (DMT)-like permease